MTMINQTTFLALSTNEIASLARAAGPQVCVFPINGTRRWFMLEHGHKIKENFVQTYSDITGKKHIDLYQLCFDHGLDTLVTPVFGAELFTRGDEYMKKIGADGMARLATHPDFLAFYENYKVRVHFYGDYKKYLLGTPYSYLCDLFDNVTKATEKNNNYRLFYGTFANDATETVAEFSIEHFKKTGRAPTRTELIEQYYGEYIPPATLFIGFDKFSVFDYPMLNLGEEDLYFTVAPSFYLNEENLRKILYDHLYLRHTDDVDYAKLSKDEFISMRNFYQSNLENTLGVGELHNGIWYPISLVKL